MAFVNGFITRYECPVCRIGMPFSYRKGIDKSEYKHQDGCVVFINGYPSPCENNGKVLTEDKVIVVKEPNIIASHSTMAL